MSASNIILIQKREDGFVAQEVNMDTGLILTEIEYGNKSKVVEAAVRYASNNEIEYGIKDES